MSDFPLKNSAERSCYEDKSGQKREFETFFRQMYDRLCSFAFGYVNDRDEAEDIVQAAFLNVWEQKEIWSDFENAKAYMFRSVRNKALNYKKHESVKQKSEREIQLRVKEWKKYQQSDGSIGKKVKLIREGIQQLPKRRREIFKLSRENGLTYQEIADTLEISIKTVETQIGRSLKFLRSYVTEHNLTVILFMFILIL